LRSEGLERELIGRDPHTTNNRMELKATIEGLAALEQICEVEVVLESAYLLRGVTERLARWKTNGWKTAPWGRSCSTRQEHLRQMSDAQQFQHARCHVGEFKDT